MKKIIGCLAAAILFTVGVQTQSFASDWDKAGKILAVLEGVRVLTGGNVDPIGTVTGINRVAVAQPQQRYISGVRPSHIQAYREGYGPYGYRREIREYRRVWVPHFVWVTRYVSAHIEYIPGRGKIRVPGHYEKRQIERGGRWETRYDRH